jgi:membrane-associated phospholipid phosphatase
MALLAATVTLGFAPNAAAEPRRAHELEHVEPWFLAAEFGGSALFSTLIFVAAGPPASHCSWCGSDAFDESVRRALLADNPRAPAAFSHALSSAAAPVLALGALVPTALSEGQTRHAVENVVIAGDAVMITLGLTHASKRVFDRERPGVHHGVMGRTEYADSPAQWNQSFFSADTSVAFALASSATTVSYLRGYSIAPYVLALGSAIGVGTACGRIAADVHWATDVITGAVLGTAVGFALPFTLHRRRSSAAAADGTETTERAVTVVPLLGRGELGVFASGRF